MRLPKGADPEVARRAVELLDAAGEGLVDALLALADRKAGARAVVAVLERRAPHDVLSALAERAGLGADEPPRLLLRRGARRDEAAQVRSNPIAINEGFACARCGFDVPPAPGSAVRNHCPRCLHSLHVDGAAPGDRASDCGGVMAPLDARQRGGAWQVRQRCLRCGHERWNGLHPEWAVEPDRLDALP